MMNDYFHEDIYSFFYLVVIGYIRWPGTEGLNLSIVRVALLNCLFVSGRLQSSSEKHFGVRVVILCPEKWDNVTHRNCCEWKKEVCVSNADWAFSLTGRCRHLLTMTCKTERNPGQGVGAVCVCAFQIPKTTY